MNKSKIEWCDSTWNPVTGCLHECEYCYARKIANRFGQYHDDYDLNDPTFKAELFMRHDNPYPYLFAPTFHRYRLKELEKKTKPQKIFVCSMADLFGDWVPLEWIDEVFQACHYTDRHKYLFLTKNPKRYDKAISFSDCEERGHEIEMWDNFWFGTTVTGQDEYFDRLMELTIFPEGHKFISLEPLQSQIELRSYNSSKSIEWVIVGAQTGPGAKPPDREWVQDILVQCRHEGIPVFLKNNLKWPVKIQEWPKGLSL